VSGKQVTDQQVNLYMKFRKNNTQKVAAAKAGISESSGYRIEKQALQPKNGQRSWRTRPDPLESIWDSVVIPLLEKDTDISPVGIYDHLCEHYQDKFNPSSRRTLERRVKQWRHLNAGSGDVVFVQHHEPGRLGIADFTKVQYPVSILGEVLQHQLFHFRLPACGWAFAQVIYGGESFAAFSDGLQNALIAAGGVPAEIRTDSLSAAYKNRTEQDDFTERFTELMRHYGFKASRNNRGVAQENGAIESPNRHIKAQLEQALRIRGSYDFTSRSDYEAFVQSIIERRNRRVADKLAQEQRQLQPLPVHTSVNYTEHYLRVSRTSTIALKRVTYTVPSRLVGSRLLVRLYDSRLELYLGTVLTDTLPRVYAQGSKRVRSVNYRHVIEALVKKPRAFRHSQWRDELLPSDNYKHIWSHVNDTMMADKACYYIVRLLHLASKTGHEQRLGEFVMNEIEHGRVPSIYDCEERFTCPPAAIPKMTVHQHALSQYQSLLHGGNHG